MKLADDALIGIIEILRKGLSDGIDVSEMLRSLDLVPDLLGKLKLGAPIEDMDEWKQ